VAMGMVRSFNGPSRSSLLPLIVSTEAFPNAVAWSSGVFEFSAVGGPLLAGAMIKLTGHLLGHDAAWPVYLGTALGCAIFAGTAVGIHIPRTAPTSERQERVRTPEGRCANCGYDLSGLEDPVRCPQCG